MIEKDIYPLQLLGAVTRLKQYHPHLIHLLQGAFIRVRGPLIANSIFLNYYVL